MNSLKNIFRGKKNKQETRITGVGEINQSDVDVQLNNETSSSSSSNSKAKDKKAPVKLWYNENDTIIEENTYNEEVYRVVNNNSVGMRRYLPNGTFENLGVVPADTFIGIVSCTKNTRCYPSPILYYTLIDDAEIERYDSLDDIKDEFNPEINDNALQVAILRTSNVFCLLTDESLFYVLPKLEPMNKTRGEPFIRLGEETISEAHAYLILSGEIENASAETGGIVYGNKYEGQIFGESLFRKDYSPTEKLTRLGVSRVFSESCGVLAFKLDILDILSPLEKTKFVKEMRFQINEMDRINLSHRVKLDYNKLS